MSYVTKLNVRNEVGVSLLTWLKLIIAFFILLKMQLEISFTAGIELTFGLGFVYVVTSFYVGHLFCNSLPIYKKIAHKYSSFESLDDTFVNLYLLSSITIYIFAFLLPFILLGNSILELALIFLNSLYPVSKIIFSLIILSLVVITVILVTGVTEFELSKHSTPKNLKNSFITLKNSFSIGQILAISVPLVLVVLLA